MVVIRGVPSQMISAVQPLKDELMLVSVSGNVMDVK